VLGKTIFIPANVTFPGRLTKLCLFTRWADMPDKWTVSLEVRSGDEILLDRDKATVTADIKAPQELANVNFQVPGFPITRFGDIQFKIYSGTTDKPTSVVSLTVAPEKISS
jgi:hypothetical protein